MLCTVLIPVRAPEQAQAQEPTTVGDQVSQQVLNTHPVHLCARYIELNLICALPIGLIQIVYRKLTNFNKCLINNVGITYKFNGRGKSDANTIQNVIYLSSNSVWIFARMAQ